MGYGQKREGGTRWPHGMVSRYLQSSVDGVGRLAQNRLLSLILGGVGAAVQVRTCTSRDSWGHTKTQRLI